MGFINRIEQGLEKAVRGTFSKGGGVFEPVDLANRIRTDMDNKAYAISSGRTIAPNVFTLEFAAEDFPRVQKWGAALAEELCDVAIRHARTQGYSLRGSVRVTFTVAEEVEPGDFEVHSSQEKVAAPNQRQESPSHQQAYRQPEPQLQQPASIRQSAFDTPESAAESRLHRQPRVPRPPRRNQPEPSQHPSNHSPLTAPTQLSPQVGFGQSYAQQPQVVLEINGENYSVRDLPVVLGRGSNADITVEDTGVSRRHLEIMEQDGVYLAVDLGSTNGSFVNGEKLMGRREIGNGSVITMGRARIVFRLMVPRGER